MSDKPVKMGRRPKFTPKMEQEIIKYARLGLKMETVAASVAVHVRTIYAWLQAGAEDFEAGRETRYSSFFRKVMKARADSKATVIARILKAGETDWRADAWFAERNWPEDYGRPYRTDPKVRAMIEAVMAATGVELTDMATDDEDPEPE